MLFMLSSTLDLCMLVSVFIIIYFIWKFIPNLILHFPIFSIIIQKPYYRQSVDFTMAGFADALKPKFFFLVCTLRDGKLRSVSG
jgi:hypothetical protein